MTKKIFAISTLLLVLIVAFAFIYNFVFKKPSASQSDSSSTPKTTLADEGKVATQNQNSGFGTAEGTTPSEQSNANATDTDNSSVSASSITSVSDEPVFGATLSADGKFLYYFLAGNGQLNQVSFDGKLGKVLSTERYENIKKITWTKQKNRAIIKTALPAGKIKFLTYDLATKKVSVLKENTDSVTWSNMGAKIIYKYYNPKTKKRTISISDPDGKNWKDIADFDFRSAEIAPVPNSSDISFWPTAAAFLPTVVGVAPF